PEEVDVLLRHGPVERQPVEQLDLVEGLVGLRHHEPQRHGGRVEQAARHLLRSQGVDRVAQHDGGLRRLVLEDLGLDRLTEGLGELHGSAAYDPSSPCSTRNTASGGVSPSSCPPASPSLPTSRVSSRAAVRSIRSPVSISRWARRGPPSSARCSPTTGSPASRASMPRRSSSSTSPGA